LRTLVRRRFLIIAIGAGLAAVPLALPAGGSAGTRVAACVMRPCHYDVQVVIAYTVQGRAAVSVVARFPRVALRKSYSRRGMDTGNTPKVLGTVSADVEVRGQDCTHHKTYAAPARLDVRANIGHRGGSLDRVRLA